MLVPPPSGNLKEYDLNRPHHLVRHSIALGTCLAAVIVPGSPLAITQANAQTSSAASTSSAANLLLNGCFTDPSVGTAAKYSGSYMSVPPASTGVPHWTIGGAGVQAVGTYWPPSPGCPGSVWLADDNPGFVSQSVPTTPGARYVLQWQTGGKGETEGPNALHVLWGGVTVAVQKTPTTPWQSGEVMVTATKASTTVEFSASLSGPGSGPTLGSVSLVLAPTVNGFVAPGLTGPFGSAEATMLKHVPSVAKIPSSASVCTVQALAANQVNGGAGLQLVWTIAPSAAYLKESGPARASSAQAVEQYLTSLVAKSMSLYTAALQAERVPEAGANDLANSWSVEVQSVSTTGPLMTFSLTTSKAGTVPAWSNVPGVPSSASKAMAATALANLLYYSKTVA